MGRNDYYKNSLNVYLVHTMALYKKAARYTLRKKSLYDPYLKFLDFSQLLVADTPEDLCFDIFEKGHILMPLSG